MFFRRKEPKKTTPESNTTPQTPKRTSIARKESKERGPTTFNAVDKRRQYRVRKSEAYPLRVSVEGPRDETVEGDCLDISLGGAAVLFEIANDPRLGRGKEIELYIRSEARPNSIRAAAKVVRADREGPAAVRYSFTFTRLHEIFAQLDPFYARFFNRRRHMRVIPDVNEKVPVRLNWPGGEIGAKAHDISTGGMGLLLSREKAAKLNGIERVSVTVSLPCSNGTLCGRATIKVRMGFAKNVLFGLEFEKDSGIDSSNATLKRFIEDRVVAIRRWNALAAGDRRTGR